MDLLCYTCGKELIGITESYVKEHNEFNRSRGIGSGMLLAIHKECFESRSERIRRFDSSRTISSSGLVVWETPSVNSEFMETQ